LETGLSEDGPTGVNDEDDHRQERDERESELDEFSAFGPPAAGHSAAGSIGWFHNLHCLLQSDLPLP
jgi:hypothetical protein